MGCFCWVAKNGGCQRNIWLTSFTVLPPRQTFSYAVPYKIAPPHVTFPPAQFHTYLVRLNIESLGKTTLKTCTSNHIETRENTHPSVHPYRYPYSTLRMTVPSTSSISNPAISSTVTMKKPADDSLHFYLNTIF